MKWYGFLFLVFLAFGAKAQNWSSLASVRMSVQIDESKPSMTLNWVLESDALNYVITRRLAGSTVWGVSLATVAGTISKYTDTTVIKGQAYEYRVKKIGTSINGVGYLTGGIAVPALAPKKSILLLIDDRIKDGIQSEIGRLINDLENESWHVIRQDVPVSSTSIEVKNLIKGVRSNYVGLSTVFIIGHVAVPYSGNAAWDGHTDHNGAWPSDTYYADLDGNWTDVSVNTTNPARNQNKNIPGDGKFDQSQLPSDADLEVGRVDFFDMPVFVKSETQLLKNYLDKDHLFRTGKIKAGQKAVVADNFNFQGEFFGSSGYKNFSSFFGPDSVITADYRGSLLNSSYMWSYGAGGGTYTSAGGISSSTSMATDSLRGIFTLLFGSYHGDWDSQNNFMRSALGSGTVLTCAWAGRPGWQFHHMALGMNIGFSTRTSMNNNGAQYEVSNVGLRGTHMGLMGDPSLNMYPLAAPENLNIVEVNENIILNWKSSTDAKNGYSIFRKSKSEHYYRMIASQIKDTFHIDKCLKIDSIYDYLVTATQLIQNASGSFYLNSTGARKSITIQNDNITLADLKHTLDYEFITAETKSKNYLSLTWSMDGKTGTDTIYNDRIECSQNGSAKLTHIAIGACNSDTAETSFDYLCSTPRVIQSSISPVILCYGDSTIISIDEIEGAAPFTYQWSQGISDQSISSKVAGKVSVIITSAKNTSSRMEFDLPSFTELIIDSILVKGEVPGFGRGKVLAVNSTGGVEPHTFDIKGNFDPEDLPAGEYELILTDANGCKVSKKFIITLNTSTICLSESHVQVYPNPTKEDLWINFDGLISGSIQILVYDLTGKVKHTYKFYESNPRFLKLKLNELVAGSYMLSIEDGNRHIKIPFIKS